jgi:hypothetical protein
MAKKNSNSTPGSAAAKSARPSAAKRSAKARSTAPAKTALQTGFSSDQIGHTAGQVWDVLTRRDGQSLAELKKSTAAPADLVVAAVGWLAREGKLEFAANGRSVTVSLR